MPSLPPAKAETGHAPPRATGIMRSVQARLLRNAAGYGVYGTDGRRLGTVIELVTEGEDRDAFVAIRVDRIFLWRRRMVPLATVAAVNPKERAVLLLLDEAGVERVHERRAEEMRQGWVADRIAPYADAPIADVPTAGATVYESPELTETRARGSPTSEDSLPLPAVERNPEDARQQHVLFVPSAAGYVLLERSGPPPQHAETVQLNEPVGRFVVVKLAQSPLPDDSRRCAYLDRLG